jgi:hypothetical protein
MEPTRAGHVRDIRHWSDGAMTATPAPRHLPDDAEVIEIYGSKFLLEWLDRDVLAAAAARLAASEARGEAERAA